MAKFSHKQFMERIEELFITNDHKSVVSHCVNLCSKNNSHYCRECPISIKNSNIPGTKNLRHYFPILERKLKLKKLLEQ